MRKRRGATTTSRRTRSMTRCTPRAQTRTRM
nr:MAG TPA: hypothetical protein [Caudoviricetes sp.]